MHVHICIHIHCTHIHTCAHACAHTHSHTHLCMRSHARTHTPVHAHTHMHANTQTCTHTYTHAHTRTHTYMHARMHTHSHTHARATDRTFPMISRMLGWLLLVEVASAFKGTTQPQPTQHACFDLFASSWSQQDMQSLLACLLSFIKMARSGQTLCQCWALYRSWVLCRCYVMCIGVGKMQCIYCKNVHATGWSVFPAPSWYRCQNPSSILAIRSVLRSCLGDLCVCVYHCMYIYIYII